MKKILMIVVLLLATFGFTNAQTAEETKVTNVVEAFRKAMIDADKNVLEKVVDDELSYGHSGGSIETKAHLIETLMNGDSDFKTMDVSEQTVKVYGKTAIVRHKVFAETNNKGVPATVKLSILLVFHKTKGDWKLLARQAVKIP
jgi:ketosteroid isomerase-like protein